MTKRSCRTAIAQVAAHRLIRKAMQLRKQHIGVLLKTVRNVCGLDIKEQCDFGAGLHSAHSEPYYYESVYNFEHRPSVLVVDSCGKCRSEFEKPMRELLPILSSCDDGCPNTHYGKVCMRQMSLVRVMCHTKVTACNVSLIATTKAGLGF